LPVPKLAPDVEALRTALATRRAAGARIVFTNGCFDLLHPGHVRYLAAARALGDVLVVGLNSDASVRRLKGPGRPVLRAEERAEVLAGLAAVDHVVLFDEDTPQALIATLAPDVLVKGADWPAEKIVGGEETLARGGRLERIDLVPGVSTSELLRRIRGAESSSLSDMLAVQRAAILERWARRVRREHAPEGLTQGELWEHLPRLLDGLGQALREPAGERPPEPGPGLATQHGLQRLRVGFDVGEVVREYGVLGETILETAAAAGVPPTREECETLLGFLNAGTAEAIEAYVARRDEDARRAAGEHVAFVAHELRNPLGAARVALSLLRRTSLAESSRPVEVLERSLTRLRDLIDNVLTAERLQAGVTVRRERLALGELLATAGKEVEPEAEDRTLRIECDGDDALAIEGDRRLLFSAVTNLVRNAIKFSGSGGTVTLRGRRQGARVLIEVEDTCGGLPDKQAEQLFEPFVQAGSDRSGFGLGLSIVKQAVDAHGGAIRVRNLPGRGCVFVLELPPA
jgi:rfaE bifunctional protein nucleotidyltransferase chain/domain